MSVATVLLSPRSSSEENINQHAKNCCAVPIAMNSKEDYSPGGSRLLIHHNTGSGNTLVIVRVVES